MSRTGVGHWRDFPRARRLPFDFGRGLFLLADEFEVICFATRCTLDVRGVGFFRALKRFCDAGGGAVEGGAVEGGAGIVIRLRGEQFFNSSNVGMCPHGIVS